jgi:hypothetical protein
MFARLLFVLVIVTSSARFLSAEEPALSAEDRKLLDGLLADVVFDPQGAERVRVVVSAPEEEEFKTDAWLVRGKDGGGDQLYLADGRLLAARKQPMKPIDFVAECRQHIAEKEAAPKEEEDRFRRLYNQSLGVEVVLAAWLFRLK